MIIDLRGTNGSGKSTTVRNVLKHYTLMEQIPASGKPMALRYSWMGRSLFVLGKYDNQCGGCDTIKTQEIGRAHV